MSVDVAIVGYGASGRATAHWCETQGLSYWVYDDKPTDARRRWTASSLPQPSEARQWVISPGVPPRHGIVQSLVAAGVATTTDVGLYLEQRPGVAAGITGTNGKTTVTEMIGHILQVAGQKAEVCGNIGRSPLELEPDSVPVVEISSFQLQYSPLLEWRVAVITNLAPDHFDWHTDMSEYRSAKARITARARAVVQVEGEPDLRTTASTVCQWVRREIMPEPMMNWAPHNQINALCAAAAVQAMGVDRTQALAALSNYRFGRHRIETVHEADGLCWIDDSKGTNPHAVSAALAAMSRPTVLLLGGVYKGGDVAATVRPHLARLRGIVVYGQGAETIHEQLSQAGVPAARAAGLRAAMQIARGIAVRGDAVLLSPACSSFDEFRNYAHRGDSFAQWAREL